MELYFAYGSNMNPGQLKQWQITYANCQRAILQDHKLAFTRYSAKWQGGVADIIESKGDIVEGVLYEMTVKGLEKLDEKEGVHSGAYRRKNISVEAGRSERTTAITYEVVNKQAEFIPPSEEYMNIVIKGAEINGLSEAYIEGLKSVQVKDREG